MNKTAFYNLSYGVYVCTSWDEGRPVGCVANSAMQITSSPATIAVSLNHGNYTNKCVSDTGRFAIAVLGENVDPKLIGRFGFASSKDTDKFAETPYAVRGKMPVIDDCVCWFSCKVIDKMETATHTVFLGEVLDADVLRKDAPMTYAYYHKVLKGKTAANAPTYQAEEKSAGKYVCKSASTSTTGKRPSRSFPTIGPARSAARPNLSLKRSNVTLRSGRALPLFFVCIKKRQIFCPAAFLRKNT